MKKYLTLRQYLFVNEMKVQDFAKLIGRSRQMVSAYANGRQTPKQGIKDRIAEVTGGRVNPDRLYKPGKQKSPQGVTSEITGS